ncbi:hypothetical protein MSPP1_000668 [Malassezia sp. CBS 17886]|nr:hypothetical protein MSPP1_000668 [Malassezia sp. CBS 17886]
MSKDLIVEWAQPYADAVGLPLAAMHLPTMLRGVLLWWSLQLLCAGLLPRVMPERFANMPQRTRVQWYIHIISFFHACFVSSLGLYYLFTLPADADVKWGHDYGIGQMYAISFGYFVWDVVMCFLYEGPSFVVHGVLGMISCTLVFVPFIMLEGLSVVIWELSTPFLDIHWLLDRLDKKGTRIQFVNAVALLVTYVGVRLVYGVYFTVRFIPTLWLPDGAHSRVIPLGFKLFYTFGLIAMDSLNYYWFIRMLRNVRRRFPGDQPKEVKQT